MPTCEEILELPQEGWEAIGKMSDEQLAIYLKDVTILEPTIPNESEPTKEFNVDEDVAENTSSNNPIAKAKAKKTKGDKKYLTAIDKDEMMKSLLEGIE